MVDLTRSRDGTLHARCGVGSVAYQPSAPHGPTLTLCDGHALVVLSGAVVHQLAEALAALARELDNESVREYVLERPDYAMLG